MNLVLLGKKQRAFAKELPLTEQAVSAIVNSPLFKEHLTLQRAKLIRRMLSFVPSVGKVRVHGDNLTGSRHVCANENIGMAGHREPQ